MTEEQKNTQSIDDKLFSVKYKNGTETHLIADTSKCRDCKEKCCLYICPAHVYEWSDEDKELLVNFENCLECGACRIACEKQAISWEYPKSGCGVTFKYG